MKQKHKKILGALGLVVVAAITAFAASLPTPTQATSSVTDTIEVRVVGEDPSLNARGESEDNIAKTIIDYDKIDTLHIKVILNKGTAGEKTVELPSVPAGWGITGSLMMCMNFETGEYWYEDGSGVRGNLGFSGDGTYEVYAWGYGNGTGEVSDCVVFKYEQGEIVPVPVPDTGTYTNTNNLMQTDYLITGLVIFILVGISGFMFISSREKPARKRRK